MDLYNIATALSTLLGTSKTIASVLHEFISNVHNAPLSAQSALFAVKSMEFALSSTQRLLSNLLVLRPDRKALVELDHLVITVTQSIITFRKLESLVCPEFVLKSSKTTAWERLQWARKEEAIGRLVQELERHKSSLSYMLNILQWQVSSMTIRKRCPLTNLLQRLARRSTQIS
jgi:hypothetical protein